MPDANELMMRLLITVPAILISLTVHELAHARTALAFGDPTAKYAGRITLNPLAHLDPIGTLCLLFAFFGWAKPVPVNPANLHPRGLGNFAVSLAGPGSNLCLAVAGGVALKIILEHLGPNGLPQQFFLRAALAMLLALLLVNISLCLFNLIPLFPLDGSHILQELLPFHLHHRYMYWQHRYGQFVLMAIVFLPQILPANAPPFLDLFGYMQNSALREAFGVMDLSPNARLNAGILWQMMLGK